MRIQLATTCSLVALAAAAVLAAAGCGGSSPSSSGGPPTVTSSSGSGQLVGSGSTLVEPLLSVWAAPVTSALGTKVVYSGVGSGAGIVAISTRTVDFGASDAPLTPDQATSCHGCVQIPWALSATTLAYNLPDVKNGLHLTGGVISGIYLGSITSWDDPQIRQLNPGVKLPSLPIQPVFRSDGSGDTYAFTDYLSRVSNAWKTKVGTATAVAFPKGTGAKGNSGVAGDISRSPGAIGYVSAAYALPNGLHVAAVQNASGPFVSPSISSIAAAGDTVTSVPAGNEMHIVDPPAGHPQAYPIATFTYVIVPKQTSKAAELRSFIDWAVTKGQAAEYTKSQIFAPIPAVVRDAAKTTTAQLTK